MLGCVLYEMCALRHPFTGESIAAVLQNIVRVPYEPLDEKFNPIFNELLEKLLNKDASERASVTDILSIPAL